jgi:hypothetical protein
METRRVDPKDTMNFTRSPHIFYVTASVYSTVASFVLPYGLYVLG